MQQKSIIDMYVKENYKNTTSVNQLHTAACKRGELD